MIIVNTSQQLYKEVQEPRNKGETIVLAPNKYHLDPKFDRTQSNGRLELQENMSLVGQTGKPNDVIIDAGKLLTDSYKIPNFYPVGSPYNTGPYSTGAIRVGRGTNHLEGFTITGALNGAAAIETDLFYSGTSKVRMTHLIIKKTAAESTFEI